MRQLEKPKRGHFLHLLTALCMSKAVFLSAISAPLATVFRGPHKLEFYRLQRPQARRVFQAVDCVSTAANAANAKLYPIIGSTQSP